MDWITSYMQATEGIRSPEIFRLWSGLVTIAGVLQRRVYTYTSASIDPLCPNLWITLVGNPATGKNISINVARKMWRTIKGLHLASDNVTHASFIAEFEAALRLSMNGSADQISCSLVAAIREFGVFFPKYDMEFLSILSDLYDNIDRYDEPRTSVKSRSIERPNLNIIAGVTPDFLGNLLPETAWGQGFTARMIFIYSEIPEHDNAGYFNRRQDLSSTDLTNRLEQFFTTLHGEFEWSQEAQEAHISWLDAGMPGAPDHGRLKHYASRRDVQILKLAMISSVSAGRRLYIDIEDYERAHEWLYNAELVMPDVFRAMGQKSDAQLINDLWQHLWTAHWGRVETSKRLPIEDKVLWTFLKDRVPSPNIPKIIEAAERSGVIRRARPSGITPTWIPRPMNEHTRI